jgi:hypothetical protein
VAIIFWSVSGELNIFKNDFLKYTGIVFKGKNDKMARFI